MKYLCAIRAHGVASSALLISAMLAPGLAWSMDSMTDGQLASTTGQDGITVQIQPNSSLGIDTIGLNDVVYTETNAQGTVPASFTANTPGSLRADVTKIQFTGAGGASVGAPIRLDVDATGGGASGAGTGLNPSVVAQLSMPGVRTISAFFTDPTSTGTTLQNGTGNLLTLVNQGAQATAALTSLTPSSTIMPILSIGNYASGNTTDAPRININLASDLAIVLALGNTGTVRTTNSTPLLTFKNANISSITFTNASGNAVALNLESPNAASGVSASASRLSVTPTITGLNLTGMTVDVVHDVNYWLGNTATESDTAVGGLVLQDSALTIGGAAGSTACGGTGSAACGIALNNVTAGNPTNTDSNSFPNNLAAPNFAGGMANASMGNFGITNMTVTNLKIGISGM